MRRVHGEVDCERQALNVFRMKMLGAEVVPVAAGQKTLKEAVNEAMRDWVTNVRDTHYILGTVYGAHPYPLMVRNFQRVIGDEARRQILEQESACRICWSPVSAAAPTPSAFFIPSWRMPRSKCSASRRAGKGSSRSGTRRFQGGSLGVLQGTRSFILPG